MPRPRLIAPCLALLLAGCLPNGPPTGATEPAAADAGVSVVPPRKTTPRPAPSVLPADPLLTDEFIDTFDRDALGDAWRLTGAGWRLKDGKLCAQGAHNRGAWLARKLPTNAKIEFDATSASPDGDLKIELWGDGLSGATSTSYTNATSYLLILGGWKNTLHVLARLDEHGNNRLSVQTSKEGEAARTQPVVPGQSYRFRVERADGRTLSWYVDDELIHRMVDDAPLAGPGHDHLGFNDWEAPVCFDNLRIKPLPG